MASLEAVAKKAAHVAVHELRQGVITREAEAQMYMDGAAIEEERMVTATEVAAAWVLVDGDKTEVEDDDDDEEAEAKAECDAELRATEAAIRAPAAQLDAELVVPTVAERQEHHRAEDLTKSRVKVEAVLAKAEAERVAAVEVQRVAKVEAAEREAADRAATEQPRWIKALAYRRDANQREASRRAETQHHLERCRTLPTRTPLSAPR
jgi:hypothetical protein